MLIEHFRRVNEADKRATRLAHESISSVPFSRRSGQVWERLLGVAYHIQLARLIWIERIEGRSPERPADWFEPADLIRLAELTEGNNVRWDRLLAGLTDEGLLRDVRYTSTEGVGYLSRLDELVQHVMNHATYHRGQIARLVTDLGGQRASTDYVALTRRAADAPNRDRPNAGAAKA